MTIDQLKAIRTNLDPDIGNQIYLLLVHKPVKGVELSLEGNYQNFRLHDGNTLETADYAGLGFVFDIEEGRFKFRDALRVGKFNENGYPTQRDQKFTNVLRMGFDIFDWLNLSEEVSYGSGYPYTGIYNFDGRLLIEDPRDGEHIVDKDVDVTYPGRFRGSRLNPNYSFSTGLEWESGRWSGRLGWTHSDQVISTAGNEVLKEEPNLYELSLKYRF